MTVAEQCCDYNPPLARRPTAMSHLKMFEQACEHVVHLRVKKQNDGGVPSTACCRLGNEKLRKSFRRGITTSNRLCVVPVTTQPRGEFTRNFALGSSSEFCCHIPIFVEIGQE